MPTRTSAHAMITTALAASKSKGDVRGGRLVRTALPLAALLLGVGCEDESKCGRAPFSCSGSDAMLDASADAAVDAGEARGATHVSRDSGATATDDATSARPNSTDVGQTSDHADKDAAATSSPPITHATVLDAGNSMTGQLEEAGVSSVTAPTSIDAQTPLDVDASATDAESAHESTTNDRTTTNVIGGGAGSASNDTTSANPPDPNNNYPNVSSDVSSSAVDGGAALVLQCDGGTRDTIPIDALGVVFPECNDGISGSWYCYDDGVNPSGCTPDVVPFDAEESGLCLSGYTTEDPDFIAWGAGIGLSLNDTPHGQRPWNAEARNIVGFEFTLTGDLGELPLRISFTNSADSSVIPPSIELPGAGQYRVNFDDAHVPEWAPDNPGEETNAKAVYDVRFLVTGGEIASSYHVCLTELSPIYGD